MKSYKYNLWNIATGYDDTQPISDPVKVLNDADTIPANYSLLTGTVATAIGEWHKYAFYSCPLDIDDSFLSNFGFFTNFRDWKCLRSEVAKAVEAKTLGNLTTGLTTAQWDVMDAAEKLIAVEYCRNKLTDVQITNGCLDALLSAKLKSLFDIRSITARKKRWTALRGIVYDALTTTTQGTSLLKDVEALGLVSSYYGGLEGIYEANDNVSGLYDWIMTVNEYLTNGLTTKILTFKTGWTMATFQTNLMNKLRGLY